MVDAVVLGLRADSLQETLLHRIAVASGAYEAVGLSVVARVERSEHGFDAGLASCLFEIVSDATAWRIGLVACVHPLFWIAHRSSATAASVIEPGPAVARLTRLASARSPRSTAELSRAGLVTLGPAALVDVAMGRLQPVLDVGARIEFPSIGVAALEGVADPAIGRRLIAAHRAALDRLHGDSPLVSAVLESAYGIGRPDARAVLMLLRHRFGDVHLSDAADMARAAFDDLGLDGATLGGAFA